jgi:hypothetical protein
VIAVEGGFLHLGVTRESHSGVGLTGKIRALPLWNDSPSSGVASVIKRYGMSESLRLGGTSFGCSQSEEHFEKSKCYGHVFNALLYFCLCVFNFLFLFLLMNMNYVHELL